MRVLFVLAAAAMLLVATQAGPPEPGWLAQRQIQERQRAAEKIRQMEMQCQTHSTRFTSL